MDPFGSNRLPNRKLSATERFLGVPSHAPPQFQNPAATSDELHEDDVVFLSGDYSAELNHHHHNSTPSSSSTSSSSSATPNHHQPHGILAALPGNETSRNLRNVSQHFHKASISAISSASSSASSSRVIPAIPRPPPPAQPSPVKFHQSAPVNVPILSTKARRRYREFDDEEDADEEEEEEMVPPHEIVARNSSQSPMLAYSVLEGIGRTLKGRDLRQVRNAVWRQTALAKIDPSTCQTVQGKVSCVDCTHNYDLSDIKVSVKCDGVKKMAMATTENDGFFKVELPPDNTKPSVNCIAKLLGGPVQLYVSRKNQVSQIIKDKEQNSYTISTPLSLRTSCPQNTKCKGAKQVGSSKTVNLPLPPEWGLAPTSYYLS
ncbi:hypothetical protein CR513_15630, partial [Mucuna pruriens]